MVKILTAQGHETLHAAINQAKQKTAAHIHVTVLPISDRYRDYALFYGIIVGSLVTLSLWAGHYSADFPLLLTILLGTALLFDLMPQLHLLCMPLTPRAVKHHRAAQMAMHEFYAMNAHIPQGEPFILLFVSVAERYVHVITNPVAHQKLPEDWHKVTADFAVTMRKENLTSACVQAVGQIADLTTTAFPHIA